MTSHATYQSLHPVIRSRYRLLFCGVICSLCAACSGDQDTGEPNTGAPGLESSAHDSDVGSGTSEPFPMSDGPADTPAEPAATSPEATETSTAPEKPVTTSQTSQETTDEPEAKPEYGPAPEGKVLRHAVFFSFKEDTSEEDLQKIVDAFRELPSKIEEIIDFQWGINNSPEGLNDGLTHCFLLTFKDEAGRAAYLPHPAHKAFGSVLGGHNDKVFVIDYWGTPTEQPLEQELKHAVFFRFKKDAAPEDITKVEEGFAALPSKIDTIKHFEWGINNSPERHSEGFTHCFMVSFDSAEARDAYLPHPEHKAFVEVLKPFLDAPRVMDFEVQK